MSSPGQTPLRIVLELSRQDDIADPYAMPERPQMYFLRQPDGGYAESALRWTGAFHRQLEQVRVRGAGAEARQAVGRTLRRFLEGFGWSAREAEIAAAVAAGRAVHITVRSAAAELLRLPWALTAFGAAETHLGAQPGVVIHGEWPETRTTPRGGPPATAPERVVFAWSAAKRPVPWQQHADAIEAAARAGAVPFDRATDIIGDVSPARLARALGAEGERPVAALHLLCHGAAIGDGFGLAFDGPDGAVAVDAGGLRTVLGRFADRVRLVVLAACDSGNDGPWEATLGSAAQALHRAGFAAVIGARYPLTGPGSITFTRAFYRALLVEPAAVEAAFVAARRALIEEHPDEVDWAGLHLYSRAADGLDTRPITIRPYRGLLPFEAHHARFFFGREAESRAVAEGLLRLADSPSPNFLVVAGASGAGKSSVLRAGALPALAAARPDGTLAIMKPGADPNGALAAALAGRTRSGPLLLLVDQFEEIFTQATPDDARVFVRHLWRLASDPAESLAVVCTLRVDFIGRCGDIAVQDPGPRLDAVAYSEAHRVFVAQMGAEALRAAIEKPAQRVGLALAPGLAEAMLADVGAAPGSLPLLQFTLDQLWSRRAGRALTHEAYRALGGVTGALTRHADGVVDGLSADEQTQARRLLVNLVSDGDDIEHATRRRVSLTELRPVGPAAAAAFDGAVARLVDARLLHREEGEGEGAATVEVAHEALIRKWARLHGWLEADREKLSRTRGLDRLVTTTRQHDELLVGNPLGYAEEVLAQYPDDVSPAARTLIDESRAAADALARKRRNRLGALVGSAVVIALAMTALAIWGVLSAEEAQERTAEAEQQTRLAEEVALIGRFKSMLSGYLQLEASAPDKAAQVVRAFVALRRRLPDSAARVAAVADQIAPMQRWYSLSMKHLPAARLPTADAAMSPDGRFVVGLDQAALVDGALRPRVWSSDGRGVPRLLEAAPKRGAMPTVSGQVLYWLSAGASSRIVLTHDEGASVYSPPTDEGGGRLLERVDAACPGGALGSVLDVKIVAGGRDLLLIGVCPGVGEAPGHRRGWLSATPGFDDRSDASLSGRFRGLIRPPTADGQPAGAFVVLDERLIPWPRPAEDDPAAAPLTVPGEGPVGDRDLVIVGRGAEARVRVVRIQAPAADAADAALDAAEAENDEWSTALRWRDANLGFGADGQTVVRGPAPLASVEGAGLAPPCVPLDGQTVAVIAETGGWQATTADGWRSVRWPAAAHDPRSFEATMTLPEARRAIRHAGQLLVVHGAPASGRSTLEVWGPGPIRPATMALDLDPGRLPPRPLRSTNAGPLLLGVDGPHRLHTAAGLRASPPLPTVAAPDIAGDALGLGDGAPPDAMPSDGMPSGDAMPSDVMPSGDAIPSDGMPSRDAIPGGGMPSGDAVPSDGMPSGDAIPSDAMPSDAIPSDGPLAADETASVRFVAWTTDGAWSAALDADGRLWAWDPDDQRTLVGELPFAQRAHTVALGLDGRQARVIVAAHDRVVSVGLDGADPRVHVEGIEVLVATVEPDGARVLITSGDGPTVYGLRGQPPWSPNRSALDPTVPYDGQLAPGFAPDGDLILANDPTVVASSAHPRRAVIAPVGASLALMPGGDRLAECTAEGVVFHPTTLDAIADKLGAVTTTCLDAADREDLLLEPAVEADVRAKACDCRFERLPDEDCPAILAREAELDAAPLFGGSGLDAVEALRRAEFERLVEQMEAQSARLEAESRASKAQLERLRELGGSER